MNIIEQLDDNYKNMIEKFKSYDFAKQCWTGMFEKYLKENHILSQLDWHVELVDNEMEIRVRKLVCKDVLYQNVPGLNRIWEHALSPSDYRIDFRGSHHVRLSINDNVDLTLEDMSYDGQSFMFPPALKDFVKDQGLMINFEAIDGMTERLKNVTEALTGKVKEESYRGRKKTE